MNRENCSNYSCDELLERIEVKNKIPVSGQDLDWIENDHKERLLYDYLAEKLAEEVGISLPCVANNKFSKAAFDYLIIIFDKRLFSSDSIRILTIYSEGGYKLRYTPEAIIDWLKTANIPPLSKKEKERLGIK